MRKLVPAILTIAAALAVACDSGNPVAPAAPNPPAPASTYTITLAADPASLTAGAATGSTLTLTVRRIDNGQPPANGSEMAVSTNLGHFGLDSQGQAIQLVMVTLTGGNAQTVLFAGDEIGTATLLAQFSDSTAQLPLSIVDPGELPVAAFELQVTDLTVTFADASTGDPSAWAWNFGDCAGNAGNCQSNEQNPVHTYLAAGDYVVRLTVTNAAGSASKNQIVSVPSGSEPVADFTFQVDGFTVTFADASAGNPTAWSWSFGDGAASSAQNPAHTYAAAGTYTVQLTATNVAGSASKNQIVTVPSGAAPVAVFTFAVDGFEVLFTDASTGSPTAWSWDFGDGATSSAQNPSHTYGSAGTYTVSLQASNTAGSNTASQFVTVPSGAAPVAAFTFVVDGFTVAFADASTGNPTAWSWNFGDGSVSSAQNPSHTYASAGSYAVMLTATNAAGSDTVNQLVTVPVGDPPVAAFTFAVDGFTVTFADASTGSPTSWSWDFGDGLTSSARNPTHTYTTAGNYAVSLTATNDFGSDTANQLVSVPSGPVADFTFQVAGCEVTFTDNSTGGPTSWSWDFGDGSGGSSAQNPVYTYAASGVYTVSLTVTNTGGNSTRSRQVTVSACP